MVPARESIRSPLGRRVQQQSSGIHEPHSSGIRTRGPAYNLHITTKSIGEWPQERLQELVTKLATIRANNRIEIAIRGLGWFPNPHNPRVFWAAVNAPPALVELAKATEQACTELGIA